MAKDKGPLHTASREGDALKKEVDKFLGQCQSVFEEPSHDQKALSNLYKQTQELQKKVKSLNRKVSRLDKGDEPVHTDKFEDKKKQELTRLKNLQDQLSKVGDKLKPDQVEEEYLRKVSQGGDSDDGDDDLPVEYLGDKNEEDDDDDESDAVSDLENTNEYARSESPDAKDTTKSGEKKKKFRVFHRSRSRSQEKESGKKAKEDAKLEKKREQEREKQAKEQEKREKKEREKKEKEKQKKDKKGKTDKKDKGKDKGKDKNRKSIAKSKKGKGKGKIEVSEDESEEEDETNVAMVLEEVDGGDEEDGEELDDTTDGKEVKTTDKSKEPKKERSSRWSVFRRSDRKAKSGRGDKGKKEEEGEEESEEDEEEEEEEESEGESEEEEEVVATKVKTKTSVKEEDEDEDDDDDDEEYEEEEEEESEEEEETPIKAKSKKATTKEEEEDDDDESFEDEEDEEEYEDEEEEGEEEEDEEDEDESEDDFDHSKESDQDYDILDEGMKQYEAVCDFPGEQHNDLGFKVGDVLTVLSTREDGWWVAEDEEGRKGLVPSTYLKRKKDYSDQRDLQSPELPQSPGPETPKSGKMLWKGLKAAVTETSVTDVLTAMGAIPAGFRPSTTAKYVKDPKYSSSFYLLPKLSKSKMWFSDLHWSPKNNEVRAKPARVQRMVTLWAVRNMPKVGVGLEVLSRHIRMCIFDGEKILSNIHTVRATTGPDGREWKFSPKVTGILPSLLDGDCFVRTNDPEQKLGILFEICLFYVRTKTGERGEFCCGWNHLPLFDEETGAPIFSKTYELVVKGGTPYEQDVEVDPSISRKASTSKLRSMMSANKQPRLLVKIVAPNKDQKTYLDHLPNTFVSSAGYLPFLSFYRKVLADSVLRDRINMETTDLIHHPVLASFPDAIKHPDIMDALRSTWADKMKNVKKADKRDGEHMKEFFCQIFMETCYPLLHSPTLAPPKWADAAVENARWEEIAGFLKKNREQGGVLAQLLSPDNMHQPFDVQEVTFDLLASYHDYR